MREYATLRRLLAGETIEIEGCFFKFKDKKLEPGDWYIGERNTGPKLLTVKTVDPRDLGPRPQKQSPICLR